MLHFVHSTYCSTLGTPNYLSIDVLYSCLGRNFKALYAFAHNGTFVFCSLWGLLYCKVLYVLTVFANSSYCRSNCICCLCKWCLDVGVKESPLVCSVLP